MAPPPISRRPARFFLLFLLITAVLLGWMLVQRNGERRQARLLHAARQAEKEKLLDQAIALRGGQLERFVDSAARRGGLPGLAAGDRAALAAALENDAVDALWVHDPDGALRLAANPRDDVYLKRPLLAPDEVAAAFAGRPTCHFFQPTPRGLLELRGGALPGGGWLLAGTFWDRDRLEALGRLTETAVAIRASDAPPLPAPDPERGTVVLARELPGRDGRPVATLAARGETPLFEVLDRASARQEAMLILLEGALALLVVLLFRREATLLREMGERRRAEAQLIAAEKMAAIGELSAGLAHELNNPIGVILGYAQLLRRIAPAGDRLGRQLERLEREAQRCRTIVTNLLAFSRQQTPQLRDATVGEIIDRVRPQAEAAARLVPLELAVELPEPGLRVRTDPAHLEQVLANLVNNAVQAMPRGGTLTLGARPAGGRAELYVRDTGPGLPADRERLFTPFFTTKPAGTGLGLAISRKLVENLGGTVVAADAPGGGALFTVSLPAAARPGGMV